MATYYWVGGTGTWNNSNTTNWAALSGGPGGFGPPLAADTVIFDSASGTGTCTTAATAAATLATLNSSTLGLTLGANLTLTSGFVLTLGTINLGSSSLIAFIFSSNNANVRSIAFNSSGKIILTGNSGTIWTTNTSTNFSYTGTSYVEFNYSGSVGTRTIATGTLTEITSFNIKISAGTDIISGPSFAKNLDFTGFSGTFSNNNRFVYGNLTYSSGMTISAGTNPTTFAATSGTQQITTNAKTIDFPLTFSGTATYQLQDALTMGSTRTLTLTTGTLDLFSKTLTVGLFSSANANTRSILFGTGNIVIIGSGTVWNTGTVTNFSYTGTPTVNISNNSASATTVTTGVMTEAQALNFNYTVGTYTLTDDSAYYKSVNFTGFTGTWANVARTIYGNLTLVSGMTLTAGGVQTVFSATSGVQQITTAGKTIDFPIAANANGGTRQFMDALTLGATRAFTVTRAIVIFKAGTTNTGGIFSFIGTSTSQITLQSSTPGSQFTLSQSSGVVSAQYTTISDSIATGGATWDAFYYNGNLDGGNNTNWIFGATPEYGAEYEYKLRSFTEPRRF
jgi:hypothetical protein